VKLRGKKPIEQKEWGGTYCLRKKYFSVRGSSRKKTSYIKGEKNQEEEQQTKASERKSPRGYVKELMKRRLGRSGFLGRGGRMRQKKPLAVRGAILISGYFFTP